MSKHGMNFPIVESPSIHYTEVLKLYIMIELLEGRKCGEFSGPKPFLVGFGLRQLHVGVGTEPAPLSAVFFLFENDTK
jgi:hypothetical protein